MPDPFGQTLPVLHTPRLRLRHPRQTDADQVLSIFGDPVSMRYWSREPMQGRPEAVEYLDRIDQGFAMRSLFQWAITRLDEDELVGTVTLFGWSQQHRRAELGYMLSPALWGQGYAYEAVQAVLAFGFLQMDLHRVEADVHPDNGGSVRLLERLGFRHEGTLKERWFTYGEWSDSVLFGLLRTDFLERPGASR
jgi:ribosomal-protein-alanine N-acetyltransferase